MPPLSIVDSHIHLWPASAANPSGHGWMNDGDPLTKQHVLSDYYRAAKQQDTTGSSAPSEPHCQVRGVVYIETDRRLEEPNGRQLHEWARQPTEEISFLRSIVEGQQYGERDSQMLLGLVPWAPVSQGIQVFEDWLVHVEVTAGPKTWSRIKGFRFLLQGITDRQAFERLVFSDDFISILKSFREKGRAFSFDVGVDAHSGGVWQLEAITKVIERVHAGVRDDDKVIFILNHMCKPDLTAAPQPTSEDDFFRWRTCISKASTLSNVYMKLSGVFSELSTDRVDTTSAAEIADRISPWTDHLFQWFSPQKLMFGSDWPVCNLRGPTGEDSWEVWRDVVGILLDRRRFSELEQGRIWSGTAVEAYRLDI